MLVEEYIPQTGDGVVLGAPPRCGAVETRDGLAALSHIKINFPAAGEVVSVQLWLEAWSRPSRPSAPACRRYRQSAAASGHGVADMSRRLSPCRSRPARNSSGSV